MSRWSHHSTRPGAALVGLLLAATPVAALPLATVTASAATPAPAATSVARDDVGRWSVVRVGAGRWQVTWRSPRRLPVGADRPVLAEDGAPLAPAAVAPDGRTVSALLERAGAPAPGRLDVLLSGERLDEPGLDARAASRRAPAGPVTRPVTQPAPVDPGVPGAVEVVSSDYELPTLRLPGMKAPVEVLGHVVEPATPDADAPLVLFLHGRHAWCYDPDDRHAWSEGWPCRRGMRPVPSHLGYDYAQRLLASQGYVTVSIAANGINAQDGWLPDSGADARSRLVRHHLDRWATWVAEGRAVDLSRVVLVGHSRGGEGVARAALDVPAEAAYSIAGQVLLGPTAFAAQAVPHLPSVTLLPHCDGDVADLQGQLYTDRTRDLGLGDTALHSSLLVMGANHNYFNTEWTPRISAAPSSDDWYGEPTAACGRRHPDRLRPAQQRAVGATYVAGAARLFTGGPAGDRGAAADVLPLFDGTATTVASAGDADVRAHALGGGRVLVRPGFGAGLAQEAGAVTQLCLGRSVHQGRPEVCGRSAGYASAQHWPQAGSGVPSAGRALEVAWSRTGARGGLVLADPLDLGGRRWLDLRTIVDPRRGDVTLRIRLTDATGASTEMVPVGGGLVPAPPVDRFALSKHWAQTLRVDLAEVSGVDLARVRTVELVAASPRGRVWVLDASGVADGPAGLPAATTRRVPVVSLGPAEVREGDRVGWARAAVPFTVTGDVERPSRFVVVSGDGRRSGLASTTVEVAPGQRSGVVRWAYRADRADDLPRQRLNLTAYALRGLMTGDHTARLVVLDDDRTPRVSVVPVRSTATEGEPLRWRVRVAGAVDYLLSVSTRLLPGPEGSEPLRQADVPQAWLRDRVEELDPDRPLGASRVYLGDFVGPSGGPSSTVVEVPTARDRLREGRETVGLRFTIGSPVRRVVTRVGVVADDGGR